ncbi:hypothetical protein [Enterococcus rivorum]|uniref:hypothetical protein n=1 Tax=Enterococcus rivorum TaxID=762845 RepID=UPI0009FC553D|nr:hypothetical protein [Enterococcus rivorum]MBP2098309.1 alkylhydroperoxidase/carboxymuconolactone decarboxylase family protein YurZ [Enterococcus rivorum]
MSYDNYDLGSEALNKLDKGASKGAIKNIEDIAPDVSDYIINFAFEEIYKRQYLDLKLRQVISLIALITQGDTES